MFEHLDDPDPPAVTGDIRHNVAHRADALKRRRTQIPLAIVSFLFVVGAAGIVAATMHNSNNGGGASKSIISGSQPIAGLRTSIELESKTVVRGSVLRGALVVVNKSGRARDFGRNQCTPKWTIVLAKPGTHFSSMGAWSAECGRRPWHIPVGTSRYPVSMRASFGVCTSTPRSLSAQPRCLAYGEPPPLPVGGYLATFVSAARIPELPVPVPVPVTVR